MTFVLQGPQIHTYEHFQFAFVSGAFNAKMYETPQHWLHRTVIIKTKAILFSIHGTPSVSK